MGAAEDRAQVGPPGATDGAPGRTGSELDRWPPARVFGKATTLNMNKASDYVSRSQVFWSGLYAIVLPLAPLNLWNSAMTSGGRPPIDAENTYVSGDAPHPDGVATPSSIAISVCNDAEEQ